MQLRSFLKLVTDDECSLTVDSKQPGQLDLLPSNLAAAAEKFTAAEKNTADRNPTVKTNSTAARFLTGG